MQLGLETRLTTARCAGEKAFDASSPGNNRSAGVPSTADMCYINMRTKILINT